MSEEGSGGASALSLSSRQQAAIAAALTILAALVIVAAMLGTFWLIGGFLRRFSHVFLPLAVGGVAAMVFRPYYAWLRLKLKLPAPLAVAAVFVSILVPIVAFGWFFGALLVEQISEMATNFPTWWERTVSQAKERWPEVRSFLETNPWVQQLRDSMEGQGGAVVAALQAIGDRALSAGRGLLGFVGSLAAWIMVPVYVAFFLLTGQMKTGQLKQHLPFLKPETRNDVVYLVQEFVNIVVAFFRGQLIVAFLQGLLFAVGFSLVGLRYGFILGMLLGFLNIVPYLGSMVGLGVTLPLAYFQQGGGLPMMIWVVVVFAVVQVIEGNLLTPKIMGDRTGLHPMAIIVAIFFWGSALEGILGMILAIPLTAFLVVFWRLAREKYIGELV